MKYLIGIAAFLFSVSAYANPCSNASNRQAFHSCAYSYHTRAFKKLENTYKQALAKSDEVVQEHLKNAQRAWWRFKELDCTSPTLYFSDMAESAKSVCEADKAIIREKEIRELYMAN